MKEQTYSQATITGIEEFFTNVLGNRGYAFAEVKGNPEVEDESNEVKLTFTIEPGKKNIYEEDLIYRQWNHSRPCLKKRNETIWGSTCF